MTFRRVAGGNRVEMLRAFIPLLVFDCLVCSYMAELLIVSCFLPKALFGVLLLVHAFLSELVERFVSNSQTQSLFNIPTLTHLCICLHEVIVGN